MGIRSEYDYTVHSVNKSLYQDFPYKTEEGNIEFYRPFYVVFLGHYQDIVHYVEKMQQKRPNLFDKSKFSLFYPNNTDGSTTNNLLNFMQNLKRTTIDLMEQPDFGYFCYAIQKNGFTELTMVNIAIIVI